MEIDVQTSRTIENLHINTVKVVPAVEETNNDISKYHNEIYWRFLFLNLVVLWAYQSLISAQNYYIKFFPLDHLDFWGTVAVGSSVFFLHIIQLYFGFYKYGFTKRIIPGFIGYIIIAVLVMNFKNKTLLIIAFASVDALGTLTESLLFGIAGLFQTGSFTQAAQVGSGMAGVLNVSTNTIIRLIVLLIQSIPCSASTNGWFNSGGKLWWCSPFIIGTFNLGDLIGRTLAIKVHEYFSEKICLVCALLRSLFIIIIFYRHTIDNTLLLCLIIIMGVTNGLLATVTFMVRPNSIVGMNNCERAAYLMTAALYFGIASGSIVAAILSITHLI
ncbi:unnamed protein product [Adineta steineri]|uniref:Uncharacterized protein n=1 Tax=Adineta steineri TaxID=433720 RepID=A0A814G092_9BILA|nr:unnamed protein product [Adineta steineri]CAF4103783.1 unnamed protein product [Adineta steineri]